MIQPDTIDAAIDGYARALGGIELGEGSVWTRLDLRSLNVGIRAGGEAQTQFSISPESLAWLSKMNLQLAFTIYSQVADAG